MNNLKFLNQLYISLNCSYTDPTIATMIGLPTLINTL